jgi:3-oxoacyl-[acyl-carrier protein] reductase
MAFKDKVVLVTGASAGLGRGIAHAFARKGARVVVSGRGKQAVDATVEGITSDGGIGFGVTGDVSSSQDVKKMFERIVERFGTLDILINNAARTPKDKESSKAREGFLELMTTPAPKRSLEVTRNMSDETWAQMIAVNLNGVFYCTREALKIMEPKRHGKIVNIASTAGISGQSFHSPHYSASKGGVVAFTRSVALEVIGAGVNVNCIAAGAIATESWKRFAPEVQQRLLQRIPAGRMGTIEEIASLALYLASDVAAFIVGQTISPNGGVIA